MHKAAWLGMFGVLALAASASCDDDETTNPTTSTASSMTSTGGSGGSGGGSGGAAGDAGMGGVGGECPGSGGACVAFGEECDPQCDTCCDTMGQPGTCESFMMGSTRRCTIECMDDMDCPTMNCSNNGYCRYF